MNTNWIAIGTAGALGIGAIAASAAGVANAVELRDAEGRVVESAQLRGDVLDRGAVHIRTSDDHASVVSSFSANDAMSGTAPSATQSAASPASAASALTPSPSSPASAASPASAPSASWAPAPAQQAAPVPMQQTDIDHSGPSPVSAQSPASPVSAQSPASND